METTKDYSERQKVWDMIKDIRISIMVTYDDDGNLTSRPMSAQQEGFDGNLWFFTDVNSLKIDQIEGNQNILLGYSNPDKNEYISVNGTAEIVRDVEKSKALWSEMLRTWFPKGAEDPNIALIKVSITSAEYWDSPSSSMAIAYGYVKARLTGERAKIGENKKVVF
jgi:general stress protein 26